MNIEITLSEHITEHLNQSMNQALQAERHPLWKRSCTELTDSEFTYLGILRSISVVDSGHHFLQTMAEVYGKPLPLSTYFKSLKSPRRTKMIEALMTQSYQLHCEQLASLEIDYLKEFPELDGYNVEIADGHFMAHACHTEKGENGKAYAAGFIYAMNLRNGLVNPFCCITNGTVRHHEIPVLRDHIEAQNKQHTSTEKNLTIYDKAVIDYVWWNKQKSHQNYMLSVLKKNAIMTFVEEIPFDKEDERNIGIKGYARYESKGVTFSVIDYCDPETQKEYRFITTLPTTINPGTIAFLYYKRWTIEKAFNNSKSDLKERKAWSSDMNALQNQMRFTAMAYNFMRVFEETSKNESKNEQALSSIHPSDKKYTEALEKRQETAKEIGCFVNPLLFKKRITRIASRTIRAVQSALLLGKSMIWLIKGLAKELIVRGS